MLSVTYKPFMLSVNMLNVVMLNAVMLSVVAPSNTGSLMQLAFLSGSEERASLLRAGISISSCNRNKA